MGFKFNPVTGNLDLVGAGSTPDPENFSYKQIDALESVTVPAKQQMLVDGSMRVLGNLRVLGDIVDISQRGKEEFFYTLIGVGENVVVKQNRMLLYKRDLRVLGNLIVHGSLEVV